MGKGIVRTLTIRNKGKVFEWRIEYHPEIRLSENDMRKNDVMILESQFGKDAKILSRRV